jgi:hypothetical protein
MMGLLPKSWSVEFDVKVADFARIVGLELNEKTFLSVRLETKSSRACQTRLVLLQNLDRVYGCSCICLKSCHVQLPKERRKPCLESIFSLSHPFNKYGIGTSPALSEEE